jgi:hypothetical protein
MGEAVMDGKVTRFVIVSSQSYVDLESRTSLHTVTGKCTGLSGYIDAAWNAAGSLVLDPQPQLSLEMPVENLKSANAAQDAEMKKFLGSRAHPTITARLVRAEASVVKDQYDVRGAISVRGTTAEFDGKITVRRIGDRITIDGSEMIYIRKLGLEPPKILLFQVNAYVRANLRLVAEET